MNTITLNCTFITPCWMAGADQAKAEVRAPSIRGELRWWFRVLGGTCDQEKALFGGVHNGAAASAIAVRIISFSRGPATEKLPSFGIGSSLAYLWYFAAAGNDNKARRLPDPGFLPPGTTFAVEILERRQLDPQVRELWRQTIRAFAILGSLGFRATRAAGAFSTVCPALALPATIGQLRDWAKPFRDQPLLFLPWPEFGQEPLACTGWRETCAICESILRALREDYKAADGPSPLGGAKPRQASAVSFRPISLGDHLYPLVVYTPSVLSPDSQKPHFRLDERRFLHPYLPRGRDQTSDYQEYVLRQH